MLITFLTVTVGAVAAAATVFAAYRLVPPLRSAGERVSSGAQMALIAEREADLDETIRLAEQDRRDEIEALRRMYLEQRLENAKLRRSVRERRERQMQEDRLAHEKMMRERRAGNEARHLSRLPVAALALEAPEDL